MTKIKIGIVGGGYMGKRHAAAFASVATIFETNLRPELEMVCATSKATAEKYQKAYGFNKSSADWRDIINDPSIDVVIVASPQSTHEEISVAAFNAGKHVLCEKPLSVSTESGQRMVEAAENSGCVNMVGFNYIRTPATQAARKMIAEGAIGKVTSFRGEHTEDFLANPDEPANWRCIGRENGCMGDLAPHMLHCAMAFMGPITELNATVETVHKTRGSVKVENDDQAAITCRFKNGVLGQIFASRTATGRKMGYIYEIIGTKGALRFNQEDQNCLEYYDASLPPETQGFRQILAGPAHPDYWAFCDGPAHGTGYGDQIVMQAAAFLNAMDGGQAAWPSFRDGLMVDNVVDASFKSSETRSWVNVTQV